MTDDIPFKDNIWIPINFFAKEIKNFSKLNTDIKLKTEF